MNDSEARAALLLESWRRDPLLFLHDVLAERDQPRPWQREQLENFAGCNRLLVVAPRGSGKSRLAAYGLLWRFVLNPDSTAVIAAGSWRQVTDSVLAELKSMYSRSRLPELFPQISVQADRITTDRATWRCIGVSSDSPGLVEGLHGELATTVVIDEGKSVGDDYFNALMPTLTGPDTKLLACSSAGAPEGWLWRGVHGNERHFWDQVVVLTADDIPEVADAADLERRRLGEEHVAYLQNWQSHFAAVEESGVFTAEMIDACVGIDPGATKLFGLSLVGAPPRRVLGVDVGKSLNRTVACVLEGRKVPGFSVRPYGDEMQTAADLLMLIQQWMPREVIVDGTGIGGAVAARLRELLRYTRGCYITEFRAGTRADDSEHYQNVKSETLYSIRQMLIDRAIGLPEDEELKSQMLSIRAVQDAKGRLRTVDPPRSPDRLDAFVCGAFSLTQKPSVATAHANWA